MTTQNYVEEVLVSLSQKPKEDLQSHLLRLDSILAQIDGLESPEKEELLVHLIVSPPQHTRESELIQPSL